MAQLTKYRLLKRTGTYDTYWWAGDFDIDTSMASSWEKIAQALVEDHGVVFRDGEQFILQNIDSYGAAIITASHPPNPKLIFKAKE